MPTWKISEADYDKIKASERHHFIHMNATAVLPDKSYSMTFSKGVAKMLEMELGIQAEHFDMVGAHPDESFPIPHETLFASALNAPGFNVDD